MRKYLLGVICILAASLCYGERGRFSIVSEDGQRVANVEKNDSLAVSLQDQTSLALDLFFIQAQGAPTTLSVVTTPDLSTITVVSTTGFVAGNRVGVFSTTGKFYFADQIGAPAGLVVTLDTPLDFAFSVGDFVITSTKNMNVDGSITMQTFQIGPFSAATGLSIDITRVMGYLQSASAMDDAEFGDLAKLTNGIVLRRNDGTTQNYWNAKSNGELANICYDFTYATKPPAGTSHGARFRNTYAGTDKHGVTIRLDAGDTLEVLIQDDLTGLEVFNMIAQGHVVTD